MPFYDLRCPACQQEAFDVLLKVDEPRACVCGSPMDHVWYAKPANVQKDTIDVWQENGFPHPRHFTSQRKLEEALGRRDLEIHVEHKTVDGSDKSRFTTDWAKGCVDKRMLENAAILVGRPAEPKPQRVQDSPLIVIEAADLTIDATHAIRELPTE